MSFFSDNWPYIVYFTGAVITCALIIRNEYDDGRDLVDYDASDWCLLCLMTLFWFGVWALAGLDLLNSVAEKFVEDRGERRRKPRG